MKDLRGTSLQSILFPILPTIHLFMFTFPKGTPNSVMVRDATAATNKPRMTAVTGRERGSCAARAVAIFLVAVSVTVDTSGALPTWRRLGFRTGSGVRLSNVVKMFCPY